MLVPFTPQKRREQRHEEWLAGLSPSPLAAIAAHPPLPSQRKPTTLQLLASPLPAKYDLFSQLAADLPSPLPRSPFTLRHELTESDFAEHSLSEEESLQQIDEQSSESGGIRKRKRKSTVQIKMLRQELQVQGSWSKEKIVEMSELTGLSQSQVYKWWWDQRKKTARDPRKRKPIHKDCARREEAEEEVPATKVKPNFDLQQLQDTERKVNKRLVFSD